MLNITKVELELIPDPDMHLFFKKGIRGGVSYISTRYSKANNKYLKSYDPKQESSHIMHLKANNFLWLCNATVSSNKWIHMDRS